MRSVLVCVSGVCKIEHLPCGGHTLMVNNDNEWYVAMKSMYLYVSVVNPYKKKDFDVECSCHAHLLLSSKKMADSSEYKRGILPPLLSNKRVTAGCIVEQK